MATQNLSPNAIRDEIARLQWANSVMRRANKALAKGDGAALIDMGFSPEHVEDLQKNGGFRSTSISNNTRMITHLRSIGNPHGG
ncbi:hypothetical protein [Candidatus Burkholderia verschuerenii]|uniref:hypothetical protein n=1 Tax=Candidatus Burkholderia verschuerenii TaxID=242163 RepID=UPI000AC08564|nr:hypothetical protein [Candidatus Burkholderia verschuerenii]